jgi:hypothetical protein
MRRIVRVPTSFPEMEAAVEDINNEGGEIVSFAFDGSASLFVLVAEAKPRRTKGETETR